VKALFPSCAVAQAKPVFGASGMGDLQIAITNRPYQCVGEVAQVQLRWSVFPSCALAQALGVVRTFLKTSVLGAEKLHKCNLGEVVCSKSAKLLLPLALWCKL